MPKSKVLLLLLTLVATVHAQPLPTDAPAAEGFRDGTFTLEPLPLTFDKPVALVSDSDDPGRLLVVELGGLVVAVRDGAREPEPFLNLVARVTALQGEQGLYSVALEPLDAARRQGRNRYAFASYTERDTGDLIVARYLVDDVTGRAGAANAFELLRVTVPEPFHHGGQLAFGPDGMLYVGIGNGESSNHFLHETPWTSPSLATLRGKVVRLDVSDGADTANGYLVPGDNPYVAVPDALPEIYASGFRNPWKFSFDGATGDLYLADVGNDRFEEINLVTAGGDYGWPSREGLECQRFPDADGLVDPLCEQKSFTAPLITYGHLALDPQGGQAVTGGVVSHDPALPALQGAYVYGDFVVGRLWALLPGAEHPVLLMQAEPGVTSIAQGSDGELLVALISGSVARIVSAPLPDTNAAP